MGQSADLYVRKGRPPTKKHPKCLTVLIWKENQSSVLSGAAVARLDLLGAGGGGDNPERRRREVLGGSGGILPRKILNYSVSEIAFSALGEH